MTEELVFTVLNERAEAAQSISLSQAGLREREHLEEWVLAHPEILGPDVLVISSEFDKWESRAGAEKDRLDVLGLASDGHLVVAELKRDTAPDTVQMQAIKYAAMASRFDSGVLADAYAEFMTKRHNKPMTSEEATEALSAHTDFTLTDDTLRAPRIVLVAGQFPANVTATAVWLSEMGLDITLIRVQAYKTGTEVIVTVSQHYPPPDVEDFLVAPTRAARRPRGPQLPEVEWSRADLELLASGVRNETVLTTMDLCSAEPDHWVPSEAVQVTTGREVAQHRGDYGGFAITLRTRFKRSNPPYSIQWAVGGTNQQYYKVDGETAATWLQVRGEGGSPAPPESLVAEETSSSG